MAEPSRLVIDVNNAIRDTKKEVKAEGDYYSALRYSQFSNDPLVVRLVVELNDILFSE